MPRPRNSALFIIFTLFAFAASSCGKRYVDFAVTNNTGVELHAIEINYPGGSFGTTKLAPGQTFHYHFKSLHDGKLKLSFENPGHNWVVSDGPAWSESHPGDIETIIDANSRVHWKINGN